MEKIDQNSTEITSELLRKKTSEAITALTQAIGGIQAISEEVMDTKDGVIRQEVRTSLESIQESVKILSGKVEGMKDTVKKELLDSIKQDIENIKEQTTSAIYEMNKVKEGMKEFQSEIAKQMENEKSRVSKFFKGMLDLVSQT